MGFLAMGYRPQQGESLQMRGPRSQATESGQQDVRLSALSGEA